MHRSKGGLKMKGTVIAMNLPKGFVAVETTTDITIVELLGGYKVEIGDVITGNLNNLGGGSLYSETQQEEMDVFVQDIHCSSEVAAPYDD
jgi:hypothetical protein